MIKRNQSALGIDLSDRTANFCQMRAEEGVAAEGKVLMTAAGIAELWRKHGEVDLIVIEAGAQSAWVQELLVSLGARVVVADPRKLKAVTESVRKSDVRDARMLARIGLADEALLSPTYVRPPEHRRAMALLKVRDQQVRARTATVLEIRSQVKVAGVRMPRCNAEALERHEDAVPADLRGVLAPVFRSLRSLNTVIEELDQQIEETGKSMLVVQALAKVDGVGPVTALAFAVVVGDPARFAKTRDIGAYFGLVPRREQSGQSDPARRISKAGCGFMRRLLVQCAQSACRPRGPDTALRRWATAQFDRLGDRSKRTVIVAVARKLSVLLLSLWKSGETWRPLPHVAGASAADVPQPVVIDECAAAPRGPNRVAKNAPPTTTRTHTCTGGTPPTKSANGSAGRRGTSTAKGLAPARPKPNVARTSAPARPATPSAPAEPACAGGPAGLASASRAKPRGRRGRGAAEGMLPSA